MKNKTRHKNWKTKAQNIMVTNCIVNGWRLALTGGMHVVPAGWKLRLGLWLGHHGRTESVHYARLAWTWSGLGNISRRPGGIAWTARVKGRGAAETATAGATATYSTATEIHWEGLLGKTETRRKLQKKMKMYKCKKEQNQPGTNDPFVIKRSKMNLR